MSIKGLHLKLPLAIQKPLKPERAMALLSNDSKLEIIDGANHSFRGYYGILIDLANDWFIKHLCC